MIHNSQKISVNHFPYNSIVSWCQFAIENRYNEQTSEQTLVHINLIDENIDARDSEICV